MNQENQKSTKPFLSHMCKYLGVGLISGSIVHAGTLGGDYVKYIVLIILGIVLFVTGTILEHGISSLRNMFPYIVLSTALSIGTGMVSGGTQHYLDGPAITAILFPVGFLLAYLSFVYRDYRREFNIKMFLMVLSIAVIMFLGLSYTATIIMEKRELQSIVEPYPLQADGHRHMH